MKTNYLYLLIFIITLSACEKNNSAEEAFFSDYTQSFNQQISDLQTGNLDYLLHTVGKRGWSYWQGENLDSLLHKQQELINQCIISIKQRETVEKIERNFNLLLNHWGRMKTGLRYTPDTSFYNRQLEKLQAKIADFYQLLSFSSKNNSPQAWDLAENSLHTICYDLNNMSFYWDYLFQHSYFSSSECYLYTDQQPKVGENFNLFATQIDDNQYISNQITVNKTVFKNQRLDFNYTYKPSKSGVQDLDIRAQVYKKNGDTVFLSKKIQVEVAE